MSEIKINMMFGISTIYLSIHRASFVALMKINGCFLAVSTRRT